MTRVLILSHLFEPSVNRLVQKLDARGVKWHRFNSEDFPLLLRGAAAGGSDSFTFRLANGERFHAADIGSVWYRRFSLPALPRALSEKERLFVINEVAAFLEGTLLDDPSGCVINDRTAERRATNKLRQLRAAREVGLPIPRTLFTNDRESLRRFREEVAGPIIFKPVSGFAPRSQDFAGIAGDRFASWGPIAVERSDDDAVDVVFTQILADGWMPPDASISICPVLFQAYVRKSADIRVTVVGETMFACRIHSQAFEETSVDFRRMALLAEDRRLRHELCDLPKPIADALARLMKRLELTFACIDLVEEDDGRMTFLEVNPSGQYLWIEDLTGAPITDRLADLLAEPAQRA